MPWGRSLGDAAYVQTAQQSHSVLDWLMQGLWLSITELHSMRSANLEDFDHIIPLCRHLAFFKIALPQGKVHSRRWIDTNICPTSVSPAVILPTIWRYLQTLEAAPYFLGLALSAFSLSGLLSGPLFGHWSDRTGTSKKIILFANCFEIIGESTQISYPNNITYATFSCQKKTHTLLCCFVWILSGSLHFPAPCSSPGNFMYFMGFSKWLLLSSRLVAGESAQSETVAYCYSFGNWHIGIAWQDHCVKCQPVLTFNASNIAAWSVAGRFKWRCSYAFMRHFLRCPSSVVVWRARIIHVRRRLGWLGKSNARLPLKFESLLRLTLRKLRYWTYLPSQTQTLMYSKTKPSHFGD